MKSLLKRNTIILIFTVILSVWFGGIAMSGISDGLVAYYPFNNNAIDETGNGYDGTVVGATPTDDRNGVPESAYAFDGTNDYINLGTSLNVPSWPNYAVSLWFLHDGGGTDARGYGQQILDKSTWYTDFHLMIQTMYNANGQLRYWTVQNTVGGNTIIDNRDFRDNQWHHVVINKQGKDGALWVDGVKRGTSDNVYTVINDQPLLVGYSFHGDGYQRQYFSGKIDDIRIYNRVLSEDEIEILNDVREAEDFDVGAGKFITGDDANASGGHYMWAPNGSGNKWTPSETHKLEYRFNVEQEGYYRIKGRVHAANDNDDSFWVKVNSSPPSGYLWDVLQNTNYALDYVSDRDVEDPVEVCLPAGTHTVGVYLREDGTRLDTIGLEFARSGRCFPPLHGDLEMEAEDGDIYGGKFKIGSDPNASGEKYVEAPNGSGNKWTIGEADRLEYRFTVEEEGYYRVWGGVHAAGDNDDSFWVRVDGEPSRGYLWDVRQNTTYALDYVSDRDVEDPVEVCLPVGNHTVTVYLREDGTRLDTIGLERSGSCTLPPPPPDLEMEAEDGDIYGGKFKIGSAPNASGEKYVEAPNGSGNKWTIGEVDRLEYRLTVEEEGYYRVKGRVHAASGIDDSFWVKVDGEPSSGYLWDVLQNTTYQSDYVSDRDGEDPVEVCLTAGDHTVTVYLREDGTRLDTIGLEFVRSGSCFANDGLVLNGGFEEGIYSPTDSPVNWTWHAWQPSAILTWDDTQALTGGKSVKIDAPVPNDARWIQTVDVEPNKLYFLSGWIKTENVGHTSESEDAGANLSLYGTYRRSAGVFGTRDWTCTGFIFNSGDETQVTVGARLGYWYGITTGTAWFDDVQLKPIIPSEPHPSWKILVLIYQETDFEVTDDSGTYHHYVASSTQEELEQAALAAKQFVEIDIPALTSGNMVPEITVRFPERALNGLNPIGGGWWPSPGDTAPERDPEFDSVIVIWDPRTTDLTTNTYEPINYYSGLAQNMGTSQTYFAMRISSAVHGRHRNTFKHEWGHCILYYFDAVGTAPKPTVSNHAEATDYVNCQTGQFYEWQDETLASPIPNSIYNNDSGFTHDYYSGTTATADQPSRCLGITPEAWALGGPVSHSGNICVISEEF